MEVHDEIDMRQGDEFYDRCFPLTGPRDLPEDGKHSTVKSLYRINDDAGGMPKFTKEKEGKVALKDMSNLGVSLFLHMCPSELHSVSLRTCSSSMRCTQFTSSRAKDAPRPRDCQPSNTERFDC